MQQAPGERIVKRVVVAGGGTAGHIEPALALADAQIARAQIDVFRALGGRWGTVRPS